MSVPHLFLPGLVVVSGPASGRGLVEERETAHAVSASLPSPRPRRLNNDRPEAMRAACGAMRVACEKRPGPACQRGTQLVCSSSQPRSGLNAGLCARCLLSERQPPDVAFPARLPGGGFVLPRPASQRLTQLACLSSQPCPGLGAVEPMQYRSGDPPSFPLHVSSSFVSPGSGRGLWSRSEKLPMLYLHPSPPRSRDA